jgi:hypothetical protein
MPTGARKGRFRMPQKDAIVGTILGGREMSTCYRLGTITMLAATLFILGGCETLTYQEPQPGTAPLARVRFVTTTEQPTILRAYDDPDCAKNETEWMRLETSDNLINTHPKSLGMPLWDYKKNAAKEVYVVAARQMNAMFFGAEIGGPVGYTCATPFFYTFAEGRDYEVTFHWQPMNCVTTISELVKNGTGWERVEKAQFGDHVTDANRDCLARFKQTRFS